MNTNAGVRLCRIVFLERAQSNSIERISFLQALPGLVQLRFRPADKELLERTLGLISELGKRVPLYRLGCNMDPEAARVAYDALSGS